MDQQPDPTERDIRAASTVTGQRSGHQFEIQLGHLCNNRCVFCSSGHLTSLGLARPIELQPILDTLDEARAGGASRLVFLGGEPTLHKGFLAALEHASRLGFAEIVIFTNGVRLPQPGFIDECVALGNFTWRISIQGANEQAHVAVTKKPRSFQRIVEGISMLQQRGQRVTTNMCVTEASYRSLPDYPELVRRYGIQQLHIDIVRPESSGVQTEEYLREIMPRYSDMAPYYDRMLEGFERMDPGFDVNVGNLPFCVLPRWAHRIHHAGENTVTRSAGLTEFEEDVDKYAVHRSLRTYTERCEGCAFGSRCTGVFRKYLALYGDEEFGAVSLDELAASDAELHNFTLLAAPLVERLVGGGDPIPAGWSVASTFRDARSRRIDVRVERVGGGSATLFLTPPRGAGAPVDVPAPVFETTRCALSLAVEGWYPADDLVALLGWATRVLGAQDDVLLPLDVNGVCVARGEDPALGRGRARMHRLVRQLQTKGRFGGWRYGGATTHADGRSVTVHVTGPEGFGVDVSFEVTAREGRSRVDALFSLSAGTDATTARPVVEELTRTLQAVERRTVPR